MRKLLAITPLVLASFVASPAAAQTAIEDTLTIPLDVLLDLDPTGALTLDPGSIVIEADDLVAITPESASDLPTDFDQLVITFPGNDLDGSPFDVVVNIPSTLTPDVIGSEGQSDVVGPIFEGPVAQGDVFGNVSLEDVNAALATIPADALTTGDIDLSVFSLIPLEALDLGVN